MITQKDIMKMVRHVTKRVANVPDRKLMHPNREWAIGLMFFTFLTVGGFAISAQQFSYYQSIEDHLTSVQSKSVRYDRGGLDAVLENYGNRERTFNQIRNRATNNIVVPVVIENDALISTSTDEEVETADVQSGISTSTISGTEQVVETDEITEFVEESANEVISSAE